MLSSDLYYKNNASLDFNQRDKLNYDIPEAIDFDLLNKHIDLLKQEININVPNYCFTTHLRLEKTTVVEPKKILIIEGILILTNKTLRDSINYSVFLDCPRDVRFQRRLDRDIKERGRNYNDVINLFETRLDIMHSRDLVMRTLSNLFLIIVGQVVDLAQIHLEVARLIKENKKKLPFGLYVTNSVQEEVGLRGAEMITQTIKPNVAIVTDVTHDTTTPMINQKKQGLCELNKGPVVTYAPAVQQKLRDLIIKTAEKNKIPFQRAASSRYTGTDTDAFAYSNAGVPSGLLKLKSCGVGS